MNDWLCANHYVHTPYCIQSDRVWILTMVALSDLNLLEVVLLFYPNDAYSLMDLACLEFAFWI